MKRPFDFSLPTRIVFGPGRVSELGSLVSERAALIVTDCGVCEHSTALDAVRDGLGLWRVEVFDGVEANPTFDTAQHAGRLALDIGAELIVGLGGGSSMDAAKGAAVAATNSEELEDALSGDGPEEAPLPLVCVPTTSGTGSEVTPFAVFSDHSEQSKRGFGLESLYPRTAVVDPELTYSMPPSLIVDTGLDVLTHAVEALISLQASPMSDWLAQAAMERVGDCLPAAVGGDRSAMNEMALAATLAGIAIAHAGTTLLHVMGYPLTSFHDVPHGRASACMLPQYMDFLRRQEPRSAKLDKVEELFAAAGGLRVFIEELGVSTCLRDYGVRAGEIRDFVDRVVVKDDLRITPARVGREEISELYLSCL